MNQAQALQLLDQIHASQALKSGTPPEVIAEYIFEKLCQANPRVRLVLHRRTNADLDTHR